MIKERDGLGPEMGKYKAVLLDLWGVVHNGLIVHTEALEYIAQCRANGIKVGLLSNAPRRVEAVGEMLETKFDLPRDGYDLLMTSGEDCWQALNDVADGYDFHKRPGPKGWFLGVLPNDQSMVDGQDIEWVDNPADADFVLNCGPMGATPTVADFEPLLATLLENETPMLCANPDRFVHRGESKEICAGALAERYEQLGGLVRWHGKPHSNVYRRCFSAFGNIPAGEVLMVGDSFITDIKGAALNGMDSALVTSGLYREEIAAQGVAVLAQQHAAVPTYALPQLAW